VFALADPHIQAPVSPILKTVHWYGSLADFESSPLKRRQLC
jgi:hypothetical protein